ncbi:hypothetical protein ACFL4D_01900 [Candidatus Margulisiibacteriota bacterium]
MFKIIETILKSNTSVFTNISEIQIPDNIVTDGSDSSVNSQFEIRFNTDGHIPYPQVIITLHDGQEHIIKDNDISVEQKYDAEHVYLEYTAKVAAGVLSIGDYNVKIEGCKQADIQCSGPGDWVTQYRTLAVKQGEEPIASEGPEWPVLNLASLLKTDYQRSAAPGSEAAVTFSADTPYPGGLTSQQEKDFLYEGILSELRRGYNFPRQNDPIGTESIPRIFSLYGPFPGHDTYGWYYSKGSVAASWLEGFNCFRQLTDANTQETTHILSNLVEGLSVSQRFDDILEEYRRKFGMYTHPTKIIPYSNSVTKDRDNDSSTKKTIVNSAFDAFFYGTKYKGNYDRGYIYTDMPDAIRWLEGMLNELSWISPGVNQMALHVKAFLDAPVFTELESLVAEYDQQFGEDKPIISEVPGFDERMSRIREKHQVEIDSLREVVKMLEYALVWADYYRKTDSVMAWTTINPGEKVLEYRGAYNPNLVLLSNDDSIDKTSITVTPNTVRFAPDQHTIILSGGNGGGKTQLLDMIAFNTLLSSRELRGFGEEITATAVRDMQYGVNIAFHSGSASTFQNEFKSILDKIEKLEQTSSIDNPAVLILDEPFRGTDEKDAIPLLIALIKHCKERNIYLAFSTHFNTIYEYLEKYDAALAEGSKIYTMNRKTHEKVDGMGESEGIDEAEKCGLLAEIINAARQVDDQIDGEGEISLALDPLPERPAVSDSLPQIDIEQLQDIDFIRGTSPTGEWWKREYLGDLALSITKHSTCNGKLLLENEIKPLSPIDKRKRVSALDGFVDYVGSNRDYFLKGWTPKWKANFGYFHYSFGLHDLVKDRGYKDVQTFNQYKGSAVPHSNMLAELKRINDDIRNMGVSPENMPEDLVEALDNIQAFFESEKAERISVFAESKDYLREPDSRATKEEYDEWLGFLSEFKDDLMLVDNSIDVIDFYVANAKMIVSRDWTKGKRNPEPAAVSLEGTKNPVMDYKYIYEGGDENPPVTPIDVGLTADKTINPISGTNGGGKTKALTTIAQALFFYQQLGYVPAEFAEIGEIPLVLSMLRTSKHTQNKSSFQNEVQRIMDVIKRFEAAGCPEGTVILLDEPFKGTSEKEAIPLLIGLIKYFERRGARVMFTTHFSGIYKVIERIDEEERPAVQPLYVEYFGDLSQRFKVFNGTGKSKGVEVAIAMGAPDGFGQVALEVKNLFFADPA